MYLADSISFEPPETTRILSNKKTTFVIIFSPKSVHVRTTLEYFTIYSIDEVTNEELEDSDQINHDEFTQKITVCVQGSCYGNNLIQSIKTITINNVICDQ